MKAAILARVSDERQAAPGKASLMNQEDLLRDVCARNGWEVARVYTIPGESAYVDDLAGRPQFAAVLEAAKRREFDIILVSEFSRFARSQRVAHDVLHQLRTANVALIGANGTNYTANNDMATFDAWAAHRASADHSQRVARGLQGLFNRGLPVGDLPFGYRRVMVANARGGVEANTAVPPEVVEEEAEAVRWAFAEYATHGSYLSIAIEFNRRGLRPRSKQGRTQFEPSAIQSILENQFYAGYVSMQVTVENALGLKERQRETKPGLHEAIITLEAWLAVQARRARGERSPKAEMLLSGIVRCRHCERLLHGHRMRGQSSRYVERRRLDLPCQSAGKSLSAPKLEEPIVLAVGQMVSDETFAIAVAGHRRRRARKTSAASERAVIEEERQRVVRAYTSGWMKEAEANAAMADITRRLGALGPDIEAIGAAMTEIREWGEVWAEADERERREVLRRLIATVEVDLETRTCELVPAPGYELLFESRRQYIAHGTIDLSTPDRSLGEIGRYIPGTLVAA